VQLSAADPDSPATLSARLAYAERVADDSRPSRCRRRLAQASSQLAAVRASPATALLFPHGWARALDTEYRIDRLSAACAPDAQTRVRELRAAAAAARRAVELYRDALDDYSMATMQFNVAVVEDELGEHRLALAALESAIAMDREFGFREDAQENYGHLLRFDHEPSGAAHIAARMKDFPERSVTLRFAWSASTARVTIRSDRARLVDGAILTSEAHSELQRTVREGGGHWIVSYRRISASDDAGVWPLAPSVHGLEDSVFTPVLTQLPDIEVSAAGDLERVDDVDAFASRIAEEAEAQIRAHAPHGAHSSGLLARGLAEVPRILAPQIIEAETRQSYSLETAMWIGATLKQGVWYDSDATLMLPGIRTVVLAYRLQFAYTRPVPCPGTSGARTCAELVIHAVPDADALAEYLGSVVQHFGQPLDYASATDLRLVIDPSTLELYVEEVRRYWYAATGARPGATGKARRHEGLIEAQHRIWSASYP